VNCAVVVVTLCKCEGRKQGRKTTNFEGMTEKTVIRNFGVQLYNWLGQRRKLMRMTKKGRQKFL